jgi:vacuolar-type H+-ATPase subunit I/STV1
MTIKAFTRSRILRIASQCGLFVGLVGTFILYTSTMFPIVYRDDNAVAMSMEHVPDTRGNMAMKERLLQTEREKWHLQLEQMRRQLNQTDTALRRERDNLQVQIELLRSELNQTDSALRRERESSQAQTEQTMATLQKERESRHKSDKRKMMN